MGLTSLSKYIISFLFAIVIILSVFLVLSNTENKSLHKQIAIQKEIIALQDQALIEVDKNIQDLVSQINNADEICKKRIQARKDIMELRNPLSIDNRIDTKKDKSMQDNSYEVLNKNQSDFAINNINLYWLHFTQANINKK